MNTTYGLASAGRHRTPVLAVIAAKCVLGGSLALGLLLTPHAVAHADTGTINAYEDDGIVHVNLSELPTIDSMPICELEDGSDIDPALLPCIWTNQGTAWLTYADRSYPIWDDTMVPGEYVPGTNPLEVMTGR